MSRDMIKPHMIQLPIMTEFGNGASSKVGSYAKILGKKSLIGRAFFFLRILDLVYEGA